MFGTIDEVIKYFEEIKLGVSENKLFAVTFWTDDDIDEICENNNYDKVQVDRERLFNALLDNVSTQEELEYMLDGDEYFIKP